MYTINTEGAASRLCSVYLESHVRLAMFILRSRANLVTAIYAQRSHKDKNNSRRRQRVHCATPCSKTPLLNTVRDFSHVDPCRISLRQVWQIVASVLHLSSLMFDKVDHEQGEVASVSDREVGIVINGVLRQNTIDAYFRTS